MVSIHDALEKAKQEQQARRRAQRPSLTVVPTPGETSIQKPQVASEASRRKRLDMSLVTLCEPGSPAARNLRSLGQALDALGNRCRGCLGVTSTLRGEGRTTVSANLGVVWAEEYGKRVLLIDGDLGNPVLAPLFGLESEPGLADILLDAAGGTMEVEEVLATVIRPTGVVHLDVLPGGGLCENPRQLLASELMQELLQCLKRGYSRIIVDLPPVETVDDARVAGRVAEGALMVVRAGKTDRKAVRQRLAWLDSARRGNVLGCVLNAASDAENVD